jgi:hypothetical protein
MSAAVMALAAVTTILGEAVKAAGFTLADEPAPDAPCIATSLTFIDIRELAAACATSMNVIACVLELTPMVMIDPVALLRTNVPLPTFAL